MKLSEELKNRGFIYQSSNEDIGLILDGEKRTVYLGIDPTASSIHVGNLVPYMLLNHLMKAGHKVILLMGGGTALIGDPGGKSEERPFVDPEVVAEQAKEMEKGRRGWRTQKQQLNRQKLGSRGEGCFCFWPIATFSRGGKCLQCCPWDRDNKASR